MPSEKFDPATQAIKELHTYALDRTARPPIEYTVLLRESVN